MAFLLHLPLIRASPTAAKMTSFRTKTREILAPLFFVARAWLDCSQITPCWTMDEGSSRVVDQAYS